jgi:hypothetical protein
VGGFSRQDLEPVLAAAGAGLPRLPGTVMGYVAGLEAVRVDVKPGGMVVLTEEEPVVELLWDRESRRLLLELAGTFTGFRVDRQVLDVAETWLQSSHVDFVLYVAETPQDEVLQLDVAKPIGVTFTDTGVRVGGVGVPVAGLETGYVRRTLEGYGIDQAMLCWQGTELRWEVNGKEMPYVTAEAGWLTETLGLLGWQTFPIHEKLGQLLAETDLPLAVLVDPAAEVPGQGCGAYGVAPAPEPTLAFAVQGTWNRQEGELALEEVDLPFGAFGILPIGISAQLRLPAAVAGLVPPTISSVEASVGAGGVSARVDAVDVGVHWDAELLTNLAEVADVFGVGTTLRQAIPTLNMMEISLDIGTAVGR